MNEDRSPASLNLEVTDQDILEAMQEIQGYLDITPGDFKELYLKAFQHARKRFLNSRRAAEVMTTRVVTVADTTPLQEVAETMAAQGVAGVPVLDERGAVAGVISEKDFLALMQEGRGGTFMSVVAGCLSTRGCLVAHLRGKTAAEIMSAPAVCVGPEDTVGQMAELFTARGINRAPVVDPQGRLLGIVTRSDLLRQAPRKQPS
ncbi:MAG: CBS domain-containing protein [Deltaproteobacteria bacterium]|nr:CBS domain-containing protein [Deltaproteobacteria bacterium]